MVSAQPISSDQGFAWRKPNKSHGHHHYTLGSSERSDPNHRLSTWAVSRLEYGGIESETPIGAPSVVASQTLLSELPGLLDNLVFHASHESLSRFRQLPPLL
jgi:hypothetical protein